MKKVVNLILGLCVVAMAFICWRSIADQQDFDKEIKVREAEVKARLIEIRLAQNAYRDLYGHFCPDWDTLVAFIENGRLPQVRKEGVLSDEQLESGLTDSIVGAILYRGNASEIAAKGLTGFVRDTVWVSLKDSLYPKAKYADKTKYPNGFVPKDICYIPYSELGESGERQKFDLLANIIVTKSGSLLPVMECGATFDKFMVGSSKMWKREQTNRQQKAQQMGAYDGLKIGDASLTWNNNAGNWE